MKRGRLRTSVVLGWMRGLGMAAVGATVLVAACGKDTPTTAEFDTLSVTTTSLPNAVPTIAYGQSLAATGGDGSYTWSVASGSLPAGLTLGAGGGISGTPSGASSSFTVSVASGDGQTAQQALSIDVNPTLEITTTELPPGGQGYEYDAQLEATGGEGSYAWSVTSGSLPTGLSLSSAGAISGTPTVLGTSDFDVEVASNDGQAVEASFSITISECYIADCTGLQGWWRLDESPVFDFTTLADAWTSGRDATFSSAEPLVDKSGTGQVDGAVFFDGVDDEATVPDEDDLDFSSDFTLMAWIHPDTILADTWQALISKNWTPSRPASLWLYGDSVEVWFTPTGNQAHSLGTVTVGTWQHVAATFDESADEIRIYIDGVLDTTVTGVTDIPDTNDLPLFFGQRGDDSFYLRGGLDEIMIWSRALSDAEIQAIYDQTK